MSCLLVALLALAAAQAEPDDPGPEEIDRLVAQLGHDDFATREAAGRRLREAADLALPSLRRRLKDRDTELRRRATDLVTAIEKSGELVRIGHDADIVGVLLLPGDKEAATASVDGI